MQVTPITIDSADDPRIAAYRDIRERDLVGRQGRFVAEGKVVLDVLFSAGRFEAESVLVLDSRLAGMAADAGQGARRHAGLCRVARGDGRGRRLPHPSRRAGDRRGATTRRRERLLAALPRRALVIALVGISNHDNMGAIFRNAAAFGADAVLLDETCCDPLYRKAIRVSVGAALKVPFADAVPSNIVADAADAHGFSHIALSPAARSISACRPPRTAGALSRHRRRRLARRSAGAA